MTQCNGMNCGTTTANHSPECRAEHAAAVAGGRFVKVIGDEREAFERHFNSLLNSPMILVRAGSGYVDIAADRMWQGWQARAAVHPPESSEECKRCGCEWKHCQCGTSPTEVSRAALQPSEAETVWCEECGDGIMAHDPGICGTCYAVKYRDTAPCAASGQKKGSDK